MNSPQPSPTYRSVLPTFAICALVFLGTCACTVSLYALHAQYQLAIETAQPPAGPDRARLPRASEAMPDVRVSCLTCRDHGDRSR